MRRVWTAFGAVVVLSFAVLGFVGVRIYQLAPPIPDRVVTTDGRIVIDRGQIEAGQNVWQSMGGWSQAPSGDTAVMSRLTGPPIGCIAKPRSSSTRGQVGPGATQHSLERRARRSSLASRG